LQVDSFHRSPTCHVIRPTRIDSQIDSAIIETQSANRSNWVMGSIKNIVSSGSLLKSWSNTALLNGDDDWSQILGGTADRGDAFAAAETASLLTSTSPGLAAARAPSAGATTAAQTGSVSAPTPAALTGTGTISLAAVGTAVTQDFDTLANSATSSALPTGWYFDEVGTSANLTYGTSTGSSTSGDTYSFGSTASTDRAFGTLLSGSNTATIGAQFTNNTGSAIGSLDISYVGEQWRLGTLARADGLTFQISYDATSLTTGTWTTVSALTFTAPVTTGTVGALNGNLAANQTAISSTLTLANAIASGQSFWIRWIDGNATSSDDGLGIDNFSITAQAAAPAPGNLAINDVAISEGNTGATDLTFTVTRSGGTAGAVTADWALNFGTVDAADLVTSTLGGTVSFADGQSTATVTIQVAGDTVFEANETFAIDLSNATGGATITDASGAGTITNDDAAPAGTLSINDVTIVEGNSGTTNMVFTVTRTDGSAGAVSATWTIANTSTNAADFTGALTGTVSFADGETSATVTVGIAGDTVFETNEAFTVTLSAPTGGAAIGDASGAGTITNDDAAPAIANVWINEFNYDPAGTDANEFIEIAGLAGTDLTGWSLVLYNGNGGTVYGTLNLSGALADTSNGFGFVKVLAPGLQQGAPDGFALVDNLGRVVQFLSYEGAMTATAGPAAGLTSTDVGVGQTNAALGLTLQLTGTGSSYAGFTWTADVANTEGAVNAGQTFLSGTDQGQISISNASVTEGNAGTSNLTFTVSRAGGFSSAATVDYTVVLNGTANAADLDAAAVLTGTVTFGANEFTRTITVSVAGDVVGEDNETLSVELSNVTGNAVIADGTATGIITNDDPVALTIMQIQGASHTSAYAGQVVITGGIVTAVDTDGFYMQHATGDGNNATSDGIFVFTATAPTVAVGDAVSLSGTVQEFLPGANAQNLTTTRIVPTSVTVDSSGNALPGAVLIGTGGLLPPTEAYDSDGFTIFNPTVDGLDFYESLEGMRITIDAPLVVGPTTSFGETTVVASGGTGATGVNSRGGVTISAGDFNPERIQIDDDSGLFAGYVPNYTQGDRLSSVTGVVSYNFTTYEVLVTEAVTITTDAPALTRNPTTLVGDADHLSMATYNLSNLDPSDTTFNLLATDIVYALGAPDILAAQEIQDADGAGTGTNLSGTVTAQLLIDAIVAAGGPRYVYLEVAPTTANATGGEPNGNIRNGYFYNPDRVSYVAGSATAIDGTTYSGTRRPLAAQFVFNGQTILAVDVHFTSRIGSDPTTGSIQPPSNAGDSARTAQAAGVAAYINTQLATNPALNVAVLGDFNGFWFENAVGTLVTTAGLNRASDLAPEEERYSYIFDNNAQQIDHILLSNGLYAGAQYDAVHINAEFSAATRPSDHDPQVVLLNIPVPNAAPTDLVMDDADITENSPAGTAVGTVSATDRAGDVLTYSLTDNAGGLFTINPTTGVLTAVETFDYEIDTNFIVVVRVTDQGGLWTELSFTITVVGVNETPTAVADAVAVDEDATSSNLYDLLLGSDFDPDAGDTISITSTSGTPLGTVQFDAIARTLVYIADNDAFDPLRVGESATDSFTYTITDASGLTNTATVTVTVNGVVDAAVTQSGTPLDDILTGADGNDTFNALAGNDVVNGGGGVDILNGDEGDDRLILGTAASGSTIDGGADTDTLVVTSTLTSLAGLVSIEALKLVGGAGITLTGSQFANGLAFTTAVSGTGSITVNMDAGVNFLSQGFVFSGTDVTVNVNGTSGSDIFKSGTGVHIINAGDGNDQIRGGISADIINGGAGDDKIIGNRGADIITGGTGSDQFRYLFDGETGLGAAADRITDYEIGVDRFNFSLFDTNAGVEGVQGFAFIGNAAFSGGGAAQLRYTSSGDDTLVQADTNGDGVADFEIVLQGLSDGATLTAADFIL
jgi:uncharacterized protein